MNLDLSFMEAYTLVITSSFQNLRFIQIGAGGTGSWLTPHLARLARIICESTPKSASLCIIDPDIIETANLNRQNFCAAELGLNKAQALAMRYGLATALEITAITEPFKASQVQAGYQDLVILIGCVDNANARKTIAAYLDSSGSYGPNPFWLDCGNYRDGGNVLIGNTSDPEKLKSGFPVDKWCTALPSPALQHPELLQPLAEEQNDSNLSCEELAMRSAQSLTINQTMAAITTNYLVQFLNGKLRCFQTYVNLEAMVTRSTYITPQAVASIIGKPLEFFKTTSGNKKQH